ncbi:MAG: phosphodiester glycosidase family protein [Pyrinomonadaceae bacterium]|nr:phosphodiester glycosidase family protein [Pyrinomonadaceae bacterium]MBP6213174.1 phosphodiester glycosidase family protein [Pyrinomonadaceae bacterium]
MAKNISSARNKQFVKIKFLVSVLCVLCASVVNFPAQDWKTLKDGIEYAEVTKEISGKSVNINLLRLDLKKVRLDVHHAMDAAIGTEKTSSIATRHGAFAAINAGFFRLDTSIWAGDAAGALMVDGRLLSESVNNRIALAIRNDNAKTEVDFGHLTTETFIGVGVDTVFYPSGINRERKLGELVLYKSGFAETTLTDSDGIEVAFKLQCRTPEKSVSNEYCRGEVSSIGERRSNSLITANELIVSVSKNPFERFSTFINYAKYPQPSFEGFRFGNIFVVGDKSKHNFFNKAEDIVAGVPQLIKNGKIDITWQEEKSSKSFVETRHPRTAVAKLKDGKFLMITVDGRTEASGGIGLQDLAEYLLSLGAIDAMNLDGGGSTTMFVDGKVVNKPSDKEGERKVSDAILVTPRKK